MSLHYRTHSAYHSLDSESPSHTSENDVSKNSGGGGGGGGGSGLRGEAWEREMSETFNASHKFQPVFHTKKAGVSPFASERGLELKETARGRQSLAPPGWDGSHKKRSASLSASASSSSASLKPSPTKLTPTRQRTASAGRRSPQSPSSSHHQHQHHHHHHNQGNDEDFLRFRSDWMDDMEEGWEADCIGGMYMPGTGFQEGPPEIAGMPLYFFDKEFPPAFESGMYVSAVTFPASQSSSSTSSSSSSLDPGDGKVPYAPSLPDWAWVPGGDPNRGKEAETNKRASINIAAKPAQNKAPPQKRQEVGKACWKKWRREEAPC